MLVNHRVIKLWKQGRSCCIFIANFSDMCITMEWVSCGEWRPSNLVSVTREKIIKVRGNIECWISLRDKISLGRRNVEDWDTGDGSTLHILICDSRVVPFPPKPRVTCR